MEEKSRRRRTRFVVVRHAEYVAVSAPRLSRKGSLQAIALSQALREHPVTAIYSSERSLATALSIAQEFNLKVGVDVRLSQWDGGVLRGLTKAQGRTSQILLKASNIKQLVQKRLPEVYRKRFVQRIPDYKVPQGESLNERYARVSSFLRDMVRIHEGGEIVVVTHGTVIDDVFRMVRSVPPETAIGLIKPYGSISVLGYDSETDTWEEEECLAVSHLPQVVAVAPTGGQLYLFPHQVAGSFPLLRGDLGELCKPATQNEMDFYDTLTNEHYEIADYIPVYLGKLKINVNDILKNLSVLTKPFERMHDMPCELEAKSEQFGEPVLRKVNSFCAISNNDQIINFERESTTEQLKRRRHSMAKADSSEENEMVNDTNSNSEHKVKIPKGKNPWSVTDLWDRFKEKRSKKVVQTESGEYVYLILENLTHGLNCPHILDLKMGTQQHGSDETEAKKKSKMKKCASTTSAKLGVRLAGMQTYDENKKQYVLRDKYWGRSLSEKRLREALKTFISEDLKEQRVDVIKQVIAQVKGMKKCIKRTPFRFYGCSILIVYDAKPRKNRCQSVNSDSSGEVEICSALVKKRRARSQSFGTDDEFQVSVRLIDFSHCEKANEGYDEGLVFGLENLQRTYTSILNELEAKGCLAEP